MAYYDLFKIIIILILNIFIPSIINFEKYKEKKI